MNLQKNKTLIVFKVDNVIDIITNSSSELFVLEGETKEIVEEMISNLYPDYKTEYDELKDIRTFTNNELDTFLDWHLGTKGNGWCSWVMYNKAEDYKVLPTIPFEETYDTSVILEEGDTYKIKNNKPIEERKFEWDNYFVTAENRQKVIDGIEQSVGRFFLYSLDENPDWDMQEKLETIGTRYHLG